MSSTRCFHPVVAYRSPGSLAVTFSRHLSTQVELLLPCGKCIGCRKENARQWAVRMMHEVQLHEVSCFLTLTYDEEHISFDRGLVRKDVPNFLKRLRKKIFPTKVRYFQCGEYGTNGIRPHYHVALFGYGFPDRERWTVRGDHQCWRSDELEGLWPFGFSEIGSLTFGSATYIARYVTKKLAVNEYSTEAERSDYTARYERYYLDTGEVYEVEKEFATMSLRPAIGKGWIERYWRDVYPTDEVIVSGKRSRPPRYYDKWIAEHEPDMWEAVRASRVAALDLSAVTPERLRMSEVCATKEMAIFSNRSYER